MSALDSRVQGLRLFGSGLGFTSENIGFGSSGFFLKLGILKLNAEGFRGLMQGVGPIKTIFRNGAAV